MSGFRYFTLLLLLALASSCREKGCTDCHAWNYNPEVEVDDGVCFYGHTDYLGTYQVEQVTRRPSGTYAQEDYLLVIERNPDTCGPSEVIIRNFGNQLRPSGNILVVKASFDRDTLHVHPHSFTETDSTGTEWTLRIQQSRGIYSQGLLFLPFKFHDRDGWHEAELWGEPM